ncbi:MAG: hypothetical protein AMK71_05465 [Nitrospira bacterium SG8_35_4]|nr:MAG: hypothetical protein AMK71_05465 [Nitrospira bacterium SG8_35_4]
MKKLDCIIDLLSQKIIKVIHSFKTRHQDYASRDIDRVMVASRLLQISEFNFFGLAYSSWYGQEIQERLLEYIFAEYMFEDKIPHWVRHLARTIVSRDDQGTLDLKEFNIIHPSPSKKLKYYGVGYTVMLTVIMVVFCILISGNISPQ